MLQWDVDGVFSSNKLWVGVNRSVVVKSLNQVNKLWVNKEAWYSSFMFSTVLTSSFRQFLRYLPLLIVFTLIKKSKIIEELGPLKSVIQFFNYNFFHFSSQSSSVWTWSLHGVGDRYLPSLVLSPPGIRKRHYPRVQNFLKLKKRRENSCLCYQGRRKETGGFIQPQAIFRVWSVHIGIYFIGRWRDIVKYHSNDRREW